MIAVTAFIFKAIIGSERTFAMPGLIFGKQERWYEYPVASGGNMHGGIFIKQISGNNDMVELIPFTLVFVCSRMIQDVGIGEKVIKLFASVLVVIFSAASICVILVFSGVSLKSPMIRI